VRESRFEFRFFFTAAFVSCVFAFLGQGSRSTLAESTGLPQPISYSPMDAATSPSGSMVRTKKIRMACYPAGGECTKNSDCCTGFCRAGRVAAYCDNP
jgi:hypothetical protein